MLIFRDVTRTDASYIRAHESHFDFVDRCSLPLAVNARSAIEQFVARYPESDQKELAARIRSGNNQLFQSAVFEIILHEFLSRLGCKLESHPLLPNGSAKRPDFLVTTPDDEQFYLEAVLATERGDHRSTSRIKESVLDYVSDTPHRDFMVAIRSTGTPTTQPAAKKLRLEVHRWLDSMDVDEISAAIEQLGIDSMPSYEWNHEGWSLIFRPIPRAPERRGEGGSLIGMLTGEAGWVNSWEPIRDAIQHKGQRYGDLNRPFLIAVNLDAMRLNDIDEMQALYGEERLTVSIDNDNTPMELTRGPNGAWRDHAGPTSRRVSGLWSFNNLNMYSLGSAKHTVYFNHWALRQLPEMLKVLPHAEVIHGQVEKSDGLSMATVLDIPAGWPEIDLANRPQE
jgi:hypothetical protein